MSDELNKYTPSTFETTDSEKGIPTVYEITSLTNEGATPLVQLPTKLHSMYSNRNAILQIAQNAGVTTEGRQIIIPVFRAELNMIGIEDLIKMVNFENASIDEITSRIRERLYISQQEAWDYSYLDRRTQNAYMKHKRQIPLPTPIPDVTAESVFLGDDTWNVSFDMLSLAIATCVLAKSNENICNGELTQRTEFSDLTNLFQYVLEQHPEIASQQVDVKLRRAADALYLPNVRNALVEKFGENTVAEFYNNLAKFRIQHAINNIRFPQQHRRYELPTPVIIAVSSEQAKGFDLDSVVEIGKVYLGFYEHVRKNAETIIPDGYSIPIVHLRNARDDLIRTALERFARESPGKVPLESGKTIIEKYNILLAELKEAKKTLESDQELISANQEQYMVIKKFVDISRIISELQKLITGYQRDPAAWDKRRNVRHIDTGPNEPSLNSL